MSLTEQKASYERGFTARGLLGMTKATCTGTVGAGGMRKSVRLRLVVTLAILLPCLLPYSSALAVTNAYVSSNPQDMVFTGSLGLYGSIVAMQVSQRDGKVSGSYFYVEHGKELSLQGEIDPVTGRGTMTEKWEGEITGYFDFTLTDNGMMGTWRATLDDEAHPLDFRRLDLSDATYAKQASALSGFYCRTFDSWVYVNGATPDAPPKEKAHDAWDWLRVRHVGGNVLAFHYRVMADNGHQGAVGGLANMTSVGTAEFTAADGLPGRPRGRLGFEFDGDTVTITEQEDCSYYRGERAHFDGTLHRADEHAVRLQQ